MEIVVLINDNRNHASEKNVGPFQNANKDMNSFGNFKMTYEVAKSLKEKYGGEITVLSTRSQRPSTVAYFASHKALDKTILLDDREASKNDGLWKASLFAQALSQILFDLVLIASVENDGDFGVAVAKELNILHVKQIFNEDNLGYSDFYNKEAHSYIEPRQKILSSPRKADIQKSKSVIKLPCMFTLNSWEKDDIAVAKEGVPSSYENIITCLPEEPCFKAEPRGKVMINQHAI